MTAIRKGRTLALTAESLLARSGQLDQVCHLPTV